MHLPTMGGLLQVSMLAEADSLRQAILRYAEDGNGFVSYQQLGAKLVEYNVSLRRGNSFPPNTRRIGAILGEFERLGLIRVERRSAYVTGTAGLRSMVVKLSLRDRA